MWLLRVLVYCIGCTTLLVASVFCLATGLYAAAEWLEDHVKTTFRLIKRGIIVCASLQLLWLVVDRRMLWPNLIGLVSHANSWYMLKRYYPSHMGLDQPATIVALVLLVAHQTAWVLSSAHEARSLLDVAAILATVVWPIPIMLLLSAGTDSELPTRMPCSGAEGTGRGSIPNSPLAASQPGSPFVDTSRLRMRTALHRSSGGDARAPAAVDTLHMQDQQGTPLAGGTHSRKGSGGSGTLEAASSLSSSLSAAWGLAAERLQQQQGFKKHRSRFVQAVHKLQQMAGMQPATVLPVAVAVDPHKR